MLEEKYKQDKNIKGGSRDIDNFKINFRIIRIKQLIMFLINLGLLISR